MDRAVIDEIIGSLKEAGVSFVAYLPDSWLADLEAALHQDAWFTIVPVTNEAEGVAMCAGAWVGGKPSVMLMENSGIRMACEELGRSGLNQGVPTFMMVPFRGDLGDDRGYAPATGWTTLPVLDALRAQYRVVRRLDEIRTAITGAVVTQATARVHVAVIYGIELCVERAPRPAAAP
jgi:sulfopyruvate decarboxylase subunit alpha